MKNKMTIEEHILKIQMIKKRCEDQARKNKVMCFFGFHKNWLKSGDGIIEFPGCIHCGKPIKI